MSLEEPASADASARQPPPFREVTDAQAMRILTHPVRLALIELLSLGGATTATEAGERIGESPTTCSFHLRQLAKYGFVEEAGGGKGRAHPWRMTSVGMWFAPRHDDPETAVAARALAGLIRERQLDRYRTWAGTRDAYPRPWQEAAFSDEYLLHVTPDELSQVHAELTALLRARYQDRNADPSRRPPGSAPVELLSFGYPVALPQAPGDEETGGRVESAP